MSVPLSPTHLVSGGQFELLEKQGGQLVRLAFAKDIAAGIEFSQNLQNLDHIRFAIALDRFVVSADDGSTGFLRDLQHAWQEAHANLFKNPTFDTDISYVGQGTLDTAPARSTTTVRKGAGSLQLTQSTPVADRYAYVLDKPAASGGEFADGIPVMPGAAYVLSAYTKILSALTGAGSFSLRVIEWNAAGSAVADTRTNIPSTGVHDWTLQTHSFTTTAATKVVSVRFTFDTKAGSIFIDDILLPPLVNPLGDAPPYDKASLVEDHIYVRYTTPAGQTFTYRVSTIEADEQGMLAGNAIHQAIELSDYLTQYQAGRSQFTGKLPSEVANRVLDGDQSVYVRNRRFATDRGVRMTLATEIPDMSPVVMNNALKQPTPMILSIESVNPDDVALFSGLPHESVGPNGTARSLLPGYFGYISYYDQRPDLYGVFSVPVIQLTKAGQINYSTGTTLEPGEQPLNMSRVFYGCVKCTTSGQHSFRIASGTGFRAYFRDTKVFEAVVTPEVPQTATWDSDLVAGNWYPFVIHLLNVSLQRSISFYWTPPSAGEALIPAANLSAEMFIGMSLIRFADSTGVIRYFQYFKRWDGKGLVLAIPCDSLFPPNLAYNTDWPKSTPVGTLVEELIFPSERPQAGVYDWGSGWTRRPGPSYLDIPSRPVATFQRRVRDY